MVAFWWCSVCNSEKRGQASGKKWEKDCRDQVEQNHEWQNHGDEHQRKGGVRKSSPRARLTAIRPLQMIGIMLLVAGVAMFHPAIRAFAGSGTLQVGCFAVGTGLIFLPMVIAGHEMLVLAIGGAGVLAL
jgi:hypothetical protein